MSGIGASCHFMVLKRMKKYQHCRGSIMLAVFYRLFLLVATFLMCARVAFGEITVTVQNETVADGETEDHSSAQVLRAGPNVTIEDGGSSTYEAGRRIILRAGFTAEEGSSFQAQIDLTLDPDRDYDKMTDSWESANGLDTSIDDSLGDLDGDGYPNLYEYLNSTDPDDSQSAPSADYTVGTGGYSTIQAAIDAASEDYFIIELGSGTYTGSGNTNLKLNANARQFLMVVETPASTNIKAVDIARGIAFVNKAVPLFIKTPESMLSGLIEPRP